MTLVAGMACRTVPLSAGVAMGGYAFRAAASVGVHDPLTVTALVAGDERRRVAMVSMDLVAVTAPVRARVLELLAGMCGLDTDAVLLAATHTHSGPGGPDDGLHGGPAYYDADTVERFARAVADAVRAAIGVATQVRVEAWAGPVAAIATDRVVGDATTVTVPAALAVLRGDDGVVGVVANYACHPTVLDESNLLLSADYVAATRRRLAAATGAPAVLFLNGACGDLSTRYARRAPTFAEADRLGTVLADALLGLREGTARGSGDTAIAAVAETVTVHARPVIPPEERAALEAALTDAGAGSSRAVVAAKYALRREREALEAVLELPVQVVRVGPLSAVGLSVELFSATRPDWREDQGVVLLACYANDYHSYAVHPDAPAHAYERLYSRLPDTAGGELVAAATRLLDAVR